MPSCSAPQPSSTLHMKVYSLTFLTTCRGGLPCPELFCALADDPRERLDRRLELARFGRLRLLDVLVPVGSAPTELRQELRLAPGLFDYLLEGRGDPADICRDRDEVRLPESFAPPPHVDAARVQRLGQALRDGSVGIVGVWGPPRAGTDEVALALANAAERPLRRWAAPDPRAFDTVGEQSLRDAIQVASVLDAVLWLLTDALAESDVPGCVRLGEVLTDSLAATKVRVLLTGSASVAARPVAGCPILPGDRTHPTRSGSSRGDLEAGRDRGV